ncbi:MAG: AAA family ATPase [Saprospiraceae bacterium]
MGLIIENLHIQNFKSVRDVRLDCERINLFVGKPNAGKSNILEAISLLGAGYSQGRFMEGFIRYKTLVQLFSNFNFREAIKVVTESKTAILHANADTNDFEFALFENNPAPIPKTGPIRLSLESFGIFIEPNGIIRTPEDDRYLPTLVKKYNFAPLGDYQSNGLFLHPPHGDNFYMIARTHEALREEISQFLKPNGLEFLMDEETQRVSVVQKEGSTLLSFPLALVPDTFQRYIFHLAAILSNQNSALLFEEPETHSYAPYVYQLAQHILQDAGNNQFFITTHNPYFLLPILQETRDVAVFVTWLEDHQTRVRRLSEAEIREVLDNGVDIFMNLDAFLPK